MNNYPPTQQNDSVPRIGKLVPWCCTHKSHDRAGAKKSDIVTLQKNPPDMFDRTLFHVDLRGIIKHDVHILIKADDCALQPQNSVFIQPDFYPSCLFTRRTVIKNCSKKHAKRSSTNVQEEPVDRILCINNPVDNQTSNQNHEEQHQTEKECHNW